MRRRLTIAAVLTTAVAVTSVATGQPAGQRQTIEAAVAAKTRTPANVERDRYRHPVDTLAFFGVKPGDTVVEFSPGNGWYTEILAPLVKGKGRYIALVSPRGVEGATKLIDGRRAEFGPGASVATLDGTTGTSTVPAGSADVVLTFRNVHNLLMSSDTAVPGRTFAAFFAALKPGGVLGVVDHRLPEEMDTTKEKTSGYIKRSTVVKLAQAAGFELAGESAINANPRDDHDHPQGVWTLPPTYRLGDQDRATYAAIGESDRMTLKFRKPKR